MLTRSRIALIITITVVIIALGGWLHHRRKLIDQDIAEKRHQAATANLIETRIVPLLPIKSASIKLFDRATAVRDLVRYGQNYFAATEGGLIEFDREGQIKHHYTTLQGLPVNDLTALAVYQGQLYLGSSNGQLITFNGENFQGFQLPKLELRAINSMTTLRDQLAVNTGAGLVLFNGETFSVLSDLNKHETGTTTTAIETAAVDYLGTFAKGVWSRREGHWINTTTTDGLLSNRVVNIAAVDDQIYLGTDLGIVRLNTGDNSNTSEKISAQTVAPLPDLSDLIAYQHRIYACRSNGEIYSFDPATKRSDKLLLTPIERRWPETRHCRFSVVDDNLFVLTDNGIWVKTNSGQYQDFRRFDQSPTATLSDNMISSLAVDDEDRIWVGLFSRGLDIISATGEMIKHIESDLIREVNNLHWDEKTHKMLAATSSGLFEFDSQLHPRAIVNSQDTVTNNLVSNNISHVELISADLLSPYRKAVDSSSPIFALATTRGLSIGSDGKYQSYTTAQGQPSNSVYTTASINQKLYIGTLQGVAVMEGGRITRTYTQSNSQLSTNWVTALYHINNNLFIGTYGGGVDLLTSTGELRNLNGDTGKFAVNLNAITADRERLYVGTLADGCLIYDLARQSWRQLKHGLPAVNVMAVAGDEKYLFIGTEQGLARVERSSLAELTEQKLK